MRYGTTMCGDAEVVTWQGESARRASYADVGERVARLAGGLRRLGVTGDDRVGTFMWNNQEHLEAYLAVPSMGAVLHTLNIRLFPEQVVYIANHAEDRVVIVDASLVPLFAKLLPELPTVRTVVVVGEADTSVFDDSGREVVSYDEVLAAAAPSYDWPDIDERDAGGDVLHERHDRQPEGRRLQPPLDLPALDGGLHGRRDGAVRPRPGAAGRADVPRQRVGPAVRRVHGRCVAGHAGPFPAGRAAGGVHRGRTADGRGCGADGVERPAAVRREERRRLLIAAAGRVRRVGGAAAADGAVRVRARRHR